MGGRKRRPATGINHMDQVERAVKCQPVVYFSSSDFVMDSRQAFDYDGVYPFLAADLSHAEAPIRADGRRRPRNWLLRYLAQDVNAPMEIKRNDDEWMK